MGLYSKINNFDQIFQLSVKLAEEYTNYQLNSLAKNTPGLPHLLPRLFLFRFLLYTPSTLSLLIMELPTPAKCTADFCLIPVRPVHSYQLINSDPALQIGTASPSVSAQIADVQRLIEASGIKYTLHSAGTTLGL